MAWIRRTLEFEPREPTAGQVRDIESLEEVEAISRELGAGFDPPLQVALTGRIHSVPSREALTRLDAPALLNSGLIGLIQWENQELIQDLEALAGMAGLEGAAADFFHEPKTRGSVNVPVPDEEDRYLVTDTDVSQEQAVWLARGEAGLVVHGPPGTGKSQVIVNVVADALAHGQTVLVICQKKAALDVVAARLRARGLADLCLQIDDAEGDRRRVIEALRSQVRPDRRPVEQERQVLAGTITRGRAGCLSPRAL